MQEARLQEIYRYFWPNMFMSELKLSLDLLEKDEFPLYDTDDIYQPLENILSLVLSRLKEYYENHKDEYEDLENNRRFDSELRETRKNSNLHIGLINL